MEGEALSSLVNTKRISDKTVNLSLAKKTHIDKQVISLHYRKSSNKPLGAYFAKNLDGGLFKGRGAYCRGGGIVLGLLVSIF